MFMLDAPIHCCDGKRKYADIKEPVGEECLGLCKGYEMSDEVETLLANANLLCNKYRDTIKFCFEKYAKWEKENYFGKYEENKKVAIFLLLFDNI